MSVTLVPLISPETEACEIYGQKLEPVDCMVPVILAVLSPVFGPWIRFPLTGKTVVIGGDTLTTVVNVPSKFPVSG